MRIRRTLSVTTAILTLMLPSIAPAADAQTVAGWMEAPHRSDAARARDQYRHPAEVLTFCGLASDHEILEIWPGSGWYADILAPAVRDQGHYTAAIFGPNAEVGWRQATDAGLLARFADNPETYGSPRILPLWHPQDMDLGEAASVDAVYTFRNLHNWLMGGYAPEVLAEVFSILRPGGTFCVVDHRADAQRPIDPMAGGGYVDEAYAIQIITAAGFRLVEVSDINDNPRDTSDYPRGVWTLPPSLRLGEEDRERYLAIGESDRFTLRFVKPE